MSVHQFTAQIVNNKAVFNLSEVEASGELPFTVTYPGDGTFPSKTLSGTIKRDKVTSTIVVRVKDITVGMGCTVTVTLNSDCTGRALVTLSGTGYYGSVIGGKAKIVIPELPVGDYICSIQYEGNWKYLSSDVVTERFKVSRKKV